MKLIQDLIAEEIKSKLDPKYKVFKDIIPPEDEPGPYLQIGYGVQGENFGKGFKRGECQITIHGWHDLLDQSGAMSEILEDIGMIASTIDVDGFGLILKRFETTNTKDVSTATPWLHGICALTFIYAGYGR